MIGKGLLWDFIGRLFNQGISFVISICLARLLLPEDFALVGMAMAVLSIAGVFVEMGLGAALVQVKEVKDIHYSSIFWINVSFAAGIGFIVFQSAPLVVNYYGQPELLELTRVLALIFLTNALSVVHRNMLIREMDFKYLSYISVVSNTISGGIGLIMAFSGYGVWSLIAQSIIGGILRMIMLWFKTKWLPAFAFDWLAVKPLWDYSKKLFFSSVIDVIFNQLDVFIIGKLFAPATLGYYARGKSLNQLIAQYSSGSLNAVLFPALSKIQDNKEVVREKVQEFYHLASFVSFLLGSGLYLLAEDIIVLMFSEKWLPTIPLFRIMVLTTFAYPLSAIILNPLRSLGRSDLFLQVEVVKKVIIAIAYAAGFYFGLTEFLYAYAICLVICTVLNGYYADKVIDWSAWKQFRVMLSYAIIAIVGVVPLYYFFDEWSSQERILHFLSVGTLFTVYFIAFNYLFKTKGFNFLMHYITPKLQAFIKR